MKYFPSLEVKSYHFESPEALARYKRVMHTRKKGVVLTELRNIVGEYYDVNQLDCVPRSKYSPEMLYRLCGRYDNGGKMPRVRWKALRHAVGRVKNLIGRDRKVKPLSLNQTVQYFDLSRNAGLPTLRSKRDVVDEELRRAEREIEGACPPPVILFARGKNLDDARPVMCFPFSWHLVEACFFYPLQERLTTGRTPYCVSLPTSSVAAKLNTLGYDPFVLEMDYTGYDGSLSAGLIKSGFSVLSRLLDLTPKEEELWQRIQTYFITSPIVAPDLCCYRGRRHGVPSGSMFTQMIDSICNMILIEYLREVGALSPTKYYVVGDDSVVGCETKPDLAMIAYELGGLGMTVNETKSRVLDMSRAPKIHFLGHTYERGLATRPTKESLERLLTPERLCREMFSKDRDVRMKYYRERVRAYMDDNSDTGTWNLLRKVETRMKYEDADDNIIRYQSAAWDRHVFAPAENVERDRWDPRRRRFRSGASQRWLRPAVAWM